MASVSKLSSVAAIGEQAADVMARFADGSSLDAWTFASNRAYGGAAVHRCNVSLKEHAVGTGRTMLKCCLTPSFTDGARKRVSYVIVIGFAYGPDHRGQDITGPNLANEHALHNADELGLLGVGKDITSRKAVEDQLIAVAGDMARLIDKANAPIIGIDKDGKVNEWNQTAARITKYGKKEVMGNHLVKTYRTTRTFHSPHTCRATHHP
jgi:PAS domain-containing protein